MFSTSAMWWSSRVGPGDSPSNRPSSMIARRSVTSLMLLPEGEGRCLQFAPQSLQWRRPTCGSSRIQDSQQQCYHFTVVLGSALLLRGGRECQSRVGGSDQ